jgi:hypothetical protein
MCSDPKKQMQSLMARFEYQGDTSVFIASFMVPLFNGRSIVSGRGASLLPNTVKTTGLLVLEQCEETLCTLSTACLIV